MSAEDKASNKIDELAGEVKETVGRTTANRDPEAEGNAQQTRSNPKQAGEKLEDALK